MHRNSSPYTSPYTTPYHSYLSRSTVSLSPSLSITSSSDSTLSDYFALSAGLESPLNKHKTKRGRKKHKKTKTKTRTKSKSNTKHRHSKKKTGTHSRQKTIIPLNNNNITPIRKYLYDEYNRNVRFSYSINHSTLKTSINIMIENLKGTKLYKIRMKWYKINGTTQTFLLSKEIDGYDYSRRVIYLYNDMDDYNYENDILIIKLKYRFVELDEWEEKEMRYYKSDKLKLELK